MSVVAESPAAGMLITSCSACAGKKGAPIAAVIHLGRIEEGGVSAALCEECGRDVANAVGFMCIREGGWSKLEPRKKKVAR